MPYLTQKEVEEKFDKEFAYTIYSTDDILSFLLSQRKADLEAIQEWIIKKGEAGDIESDYENGYQQALFDIASHFTYHGLTDLLK